jgi:hypothetical protein
LASRRRTGRAAAAGRGAFEEADVDHTLVVPCIQFVMLALIIHQIFALSKTLRTVRRMEKERKP